VNNNTVKIGEHRFIGSTLWFEKNVESANKITQMYIADFAMIEDCDPVAFARYAATVDYFEREMQKGDIVVTHHLPSAKSISPRFERSLLNCYFANSLDDLIKKKRPKLWIHGRTHDPCRYTIGNTRLVCNPLGYPKERRPPEAYNLFKEKLVISV
jgi:Icc-related predicted phosphoesterase